MFVPFLNKLANSARILLKFRIIKLYENPSNGLQSISYGWRTDRQS